MFQPDQVILRHIDLMGMACYIDVYVHISLSVLTVTRIHVWVAFIGIFIYTTVEVT
jgi:hypothetical protein